MKTGEARESLVSRSLADLAEMSFDAVVAFDSRERITYWNPAAEQLYGWTAQEAIGKTSAELFLPGNTSQEKSQKQKLKRGETLQGERQACRKDGSPLRVQYVARATFDAKGKLTGYLAITRDLSAPVTKKARKTKQRTDEASRANEDKFSTLFEKAGFAAALSKPPNGIFVEINEAWMNVFGHNRQESIGKTSSELNINPDSEARARILDQLQQKGSAHGIETILQTKSGERRNFLVNVDTVGIDGQKYFLNTVEDITERKRAEQALQESEERYRYLVKHAPAGIYELDLKTMRFIEVNDSMCEILGYTREELLSKIPDELLDKEGRERFKQRILQTLAGEKVPHQTEYKVKAKDGHEIWGILNVTVNYADGKPRSLSVVAHDITERKQVEEALREAHSAISQSEERLRLMIETSPVAIGFGDSTGKILEANAAFYRLTGYSREEIEASRLGWRQLTAPEYAEVDRQILVQLNATGSAGPYEKEYIRKGGSRVPVLFTVSKFSGRDEHIAFIMDITEHRRAENALRESRRKYQDLIETTSDFIWETDNQGRYTYCSPQMENLWGIKPEDMLGKTPFDVMPPKEREGAFEYFQEVIRSAAPFSGLTTTALNSQGQSFYVETSGVPFFDHNGRLSGFRGVTRDVTERNRTRQQVFESNQRLMALMNALPVGVSFSDDPTCQHATGNPAVLAQFGMNSEDNLSASAPDSSTPGRKVQYFHDGKQISDADLPLQRAVTENREIPPMELEVHLPSGRRWWASVSGAPVCDQNGNVIGGVAVSQDITERKQQEEQLRELSQRLTYHVDNSPLAVIEWGPDMRLIRWSGAAERIFGWKAEEVLGKRMEDFHWIYEEDVSQVSDISIDLRTGADPHRFSANRNYCKDGSVVYCEWYNSSLLDESGKLRSILSLVLDVTDRKRAEKELHKHQQQLQVLNETLEQKVQEKTIEVHRLASDVIKAVQHERHRISHILHDDLQQRIYAIQMQLTFLHDELQSGSEAASKEVSDIEQQLSEILAVTRHLSIDLSPPILRDEGLAHAISWLAAQMRQRYGLSIELQANEPFAISDEALHVLLFNCVRELLFNVVKHAQASRAIVTLKWAETDLLIEVRDDGQGFSVNALEQQVSGELTGENGSRTSLGLSTIRHQLSLFDGYMEIQSEPGAGTRIIMIVPVAEG